MKKEERPALAQNLIKARKSLGWNQSKAADMLGMAMKAYQKYEEGRAAPDISLLPVMCCTFRITNLLAFIFNPAFDFDNQEVEFGIPIWSSIEEKYFAASETARQIVDLALGIGCEPLPC